MNNPFKKIYWALLAGIIILAVVLEFIPAIDGVLEKGSMPEFYAQYALIAITLGAVYAALKMIKKNPVLRMVLLEGPALANIICYHLFMNVSFFYLAVICLIAYIFVYPANNVEEKEEDKN